MSDRPIPVPPLPGKAPIEAISAAGTPGLWERITTWASEHKAIVYTVAGVTLLVTAGGVIYYVNDSSKAAKTSDASSSKRKNKKDRKKAKKEAEDAQVKETETGMLRK
jgi:mitochondrial import receptor subunit TOM70